MKETINEFLPEYLQKLVFNNLLDNDYESFYFKDLESRFIWVSRSQAKNFGLDSSDEAIGKTDFDIFTKEHAQQAYNDEMDIISSKKPLIGKIEKETWKNDLISYVVTSKYPLIDLDGTLIGTWGHSIYISTAGNQIKQVKERANPLDKIIFSKDEGSQLDPLTSLLNVKTFYEHTNMFYQSAMNSLNATDTSHHLVMIDVGDLSSINQTYGHGIGNKVLQAVANILKPLSSNKLTPYRYGGDHFALLIKNTDLLDIVKLCNELIDVCENNTYILGNIEHIIKINFGISNFKESLPYGNIHDIINQADKRLYIAKKLQDTFIVFDNNY